MNRGILKKIDSWIEFTALLSGLSKKEKGDAFEELTLLYLRLDPKYATLLETVWPQRNIPQEMISRQSLYILTKIKVARHE